MPASTRRGLIGWLLYPLWPMPRDIIAAIFRMLAGQTVRGPYYTGDDFKRDAEYLVAEQRAVGSRWLAWLSLLAVAALFVWAWHATIDEIVRGEGKVVPSSKVQVVQSLDGGIVEEIMVRPGDVVKAGQVLLRVDATRYASSLGESRSEWLALQAKAARLQALASGAPFAATAELVNEAPDVIALERTIWESRTRELEATIQIAQQQLNQRQEELRETLLKQEQASVSCRLTQRELDVTRPLLRSGAVSEVELLRLERDVAQYCGDEKTAAAQASRLKAAIEEARTRIEEERLIMRNAARSELSDVRARLAAIDQSQRALQDRVRLTEIRSPVNGTIRTLLVNTVGGVIQPGNEVLDIVPADDTLLLDVQISPSDIGFLHVGQKAVVKFTAYDFNIYGGIEGSVEQISADTLTDQDGNAFYNAKVRTDQSYVGDDQRPIIPGMVAEVNIRTGERTVMQFLLNPILRAKENAFRER